MSAGRKIWKIGWRVALCAALLLWIFHSIFLNEGKLAAQQEGLAWNAMDRGAQWRYAWTHGPQALWATIKLVQPMALAISLALAGIMIFLGVLRWRMVLRVQGLDLSLGRATEISFIAHFFNSFLLGSTGGDLLKAYYAARETHHLKTEAVTTVFVDRLIGLFSMLLFAVIMLVPNMALMSSDVRLFSVAGLIVAMFLACAVLVYLAFWGGVSRGLPGARDWLRRLPKAEVLERSLEACRRFGRERRLLIETTLLSMAVNAICVVQFMILARGLGMAIPTLAMFFIVPAVVCIAALPITPSGLGLRENLFVMMLAVPLIGAPETQSLSLSLLAYASNVAWSIVGGIVYMTVREREHLDEFTEETAES